MQRTRRQFSHKDVEFVVSDAGHSKTFKRWDQAYAHAVNSGVAFDGSETDILVYASSLAGARWWDGDDGADSYRKSRNKKEAIIQRITLDIRVARPELDD